MFAEYVAAALDRAEFEPLEDAPGYFGRIPGFQGAWATAETVERCRSELAEVIEEWILFRIAAHLELPAVGGVQLRVPNVA
ncbi:MAG: type II toxin-antitoxin system HicB family antitoxin [Dehalococcoidia bacterium]